MFDTIFCDVGTTYVIMENWHLNMGIVVLAVVNHDTTSWRAGFNLGGKSKFLSWNHLENEEVIYFRPE